MLALSLSMRAYISQFDGRTPQDALPLAAGLIAAASRADPALHDRLELTIDVERLDPDQVVASYQRPDVLGYSCYTWNAAYSLEVARRAKARYADAWTVLGGPSVPRRPEAVARFFDAHPYVDILVFGEGELTFRDILRARASGGGLEAIPGLAFRSVEAPEQHVRTLPRPRLADFRETASPFMDGTFDDLHDRYRGKLSMAIVETNRGCPFACTFCDWGQAVASRIYELPLDRVHADLEWIATRQLPYIYLIDANFGIRPRDIEIVRYLAGIKTITGFPKFCHFHLTKNADRRNLATVETLAEAGIGCHVALSMQDFDDTVLEAIKRGNISLERSLSLRRIANQQGIPTFNEILLGLPAQTYDSFRMSVTKAVTPFPGDSFYLYLARLLENAELSDPESRQRYGLVTRHCPVGDRHGANEALFVPEYEEIVVGSAAMPIADWQRAFKYGQLLSAVYNLRLLDVVIQYLQRTLDASLECWLEALRDTMQRSPRGSALGQIDAILDRYVESILAGGPLVLPDEHDTSHVWAVEDAIFAAVVRSQGAFFEAVAATTKTHLSACGIVFRPAVIDELLRFQELLTPRFDRRQVESACFQHDWLAYRYAMGQSERPLLDNSPVVLTHVPPSTVRQSPGWTSFLVAQLAALHAKVAQTVVVVAPAALRASG